VIELKRCKKCVVPETDADTVIHENGICSGCVSAETKKAINWEDRRAQLKEILEAAKKNAKGSYDCIVPVSFGKDSSYQLYVLRKEFNMNPLAVSFDHQWFTEELLENRRNVTRKLGVDLLLFSPRYETVLKLARAGIKRMGDICWHCHAGVGAWPVQMAVKFNIPLMIWGEPRCEYGETEEYSYNKIQKYNTDQFIELFVKGHSYQEMLEEGLTIEEIQPYIFPTEGEIRRVGINSIYLGSFISWDTRKQVEIVKRELGWKEAPFVEGLYRCDSEMECKYSGVHDYMWYIKRGFSRTTNYASLDIRQGYLTRDDALKLIKRHEGHRPESLSLFLKEINMSEDEFIEETQKHCVPPWRFDGV